METKTPPPTPTPSICSHGISQTFSCNFAASQTTLKALFMSSVRGSLDPSNRSIDPDESPAVIVVRIAFHLVYKAFLTGDKSDIQPALTGLDSAQTLIDQQRSKYLNLIEYDTWFFDDPTSIHPHTNFSSLHSLYFFFFPYLDLPQKPFH